MLPDTNSGLMESYDQNKLSKSLDDIMYQRLKNRERQRRYRERKRLQEEIRKASMINQSTSWQVEPPLKGALDHCVTRVHCVRDWKRDARQAHAQALAIEYQVSNLASGTKAAEQDFKSEIPSAVSFGLDASEKLRARVGQRDWKTEARMKK
ncbi:hypothetical protein Ancab_015736 [Ancistrocladus abbreviatus]